MDTQFCCPVDGRFKLLSCQMLSERHYCACGDPTIKTIADDVKVKSTKATMLLSDFESRVYGLAGEVAAP
ncbi:hypothetical protein TUA1478L_36360 [Lactiplantibacillus plantarum]|nr:hypothetical protein LPL02_23360 [Lactiplantibacillus plantarum subsp. plantarum]GIU65237.1 hypothetical protein LPJCM8341_24220 [Lactiplantibacillus plantarum subsp. plantarum]